VYPRRQGGQRAADKKMPVSLTDWHFLQLRQKRQDQQ